MDLTKLNELNTFASLIESLQEKTPSEQTLLFLAELLNDLEIKSDSTPDTGSFQFDYFKNEIYLTVLVYPNNRVEITIEPEVGIMKSFQEVTNHLKNLQAAASLAQTLVRVFQQLIMMPESIDILVRNMD